MMASMDVTEGPTKFPGDAGCQDARMEPTREVKITIFEENDDDDDDDEYDDDDGRS